MAQLWKETVCGISLCVTRGQSLNLFKPHSQHLETEMQRAAVSQGGCEVSLR